MDKDMKGVNVGRIGGVLMNSVVVFLGNPWNVKNVTVDAV